MSDELPFGRLWYGEPDAVSNAINYAKFFSRSAVHTPLLITDHCLRRRLAHFKLGARVLTQCRLVFQLCGQLFPLKIISCSPTRLYQSSARLGAGRPIGKSRPRLRCRLPHRTFHAVRVLGYL